jgi:hypothetical protein
MEHVRNPEAEHFVQLIFQGCWGFARRVRGHDQMRLIMQDDKPVPRKETDDARPTEDDLAQAHLGGPRGAPELRPAPMTPQRRKKTPNNLDPGHTA